jgi:hypothetical protein
LLFFLLRLATTQVTTSAIKRMKTMNDSDATADSKPMVETVVMVADDAHKGSEKRESEQRTLSILGGS